MNNEDLKFAEFVENSKFGTINFVVNVVKLNDNNGFIAHLIGVKGGPIVFAKTDQEVRSLMESSLRDFNTIIMSLQISNAYSAHLDNVIAAKAAAIKGFENSALNREITYEYQGR